MNKEIRRVSGSGDDGFSGKEPWAALAAVDTNWIIGFGFEEEALKGFSEPLCFYFGCSNCLYLIGMDMKGNSWPSAMVSSDEEEAEMPANGKMRVFEKRKGKETLRGNSSNVDEMMPSVATHTKDYGKVYTRKTKKSKTEAEVIKGECDLSITNGVLEVPSKDFSKAYVRKGKTKKECGELMSTTPLGEKSEKTSENHGLSESMGDLTHAFCRGSSFSTNAEEAASVENGSSSKQHHGCSKSDPTVITGNMLLGTETPASSDLPLGESSIEPNSERVHRLSWDLNLPADQQPDYGEDSSNVQFITLLGTRVPVGRREGCPPNSII